MEKAQNILFMMTDHQRFDTIGMVQCGREVTPNLNKLVKDARVYNRAYTTCPLCVPARTALATGVYPTENHVVFNDWKGVTASKIPTIHTILRDNGFKVGHVGVDHIRIKPFLKEQNLAFFSNQDDYTLWAKENNIMSERNSDEVTSVKEEIEHKLVDKVYSNHKVIKWENDYGSFKDVYFYNDAMQFLESCNSKEKFALFTYFWAPHPPLKVPEPYYSMYDPQKIELPKNINLPCQNEPSARRKGVPAQLAENISETEWKKVWAAYLGLVTLADELMGKLIEKLKEKGLYDKTMIVFTADHGEALGQHKMYQKMEMYENAIHIPLIMKMPDNKHSISSQVVSHLDIVPTILENLGIKHNNLEGVNIVDFTDNNRTVYSQYSGNPSYGTIRRAAITKKYKYVIDSNYENELFDLEYDPYEMENLANKAEYMTVVDNLYQRCKEYHIKHNDFFKWK